MGTNPTDTYNAWYVQAIYEEYIRNPASVDEAWRRIFEADGLPQPGAERPLGRG